MSRTILPRSPRLAPFFIASLIAVILLPLAAYGQYFGRAKVQYEDFDFQVLASDHYDVLFYPPSETAAQDAARMSERWYTRHQQTFTHRYQNKPIIFYANDADFKQTNVIEGSISQGTGGVTEGLQNRVVMPLTGIYAETDHVLGHELVHSFQYDIVQQPDGGGLQGIGQVPLWLVEGMSEYLTIGREDPHTAMWLRDALLRDELPTIDDLNTGRFFPYRYGQAYSAYIAGRWGDAALAELFRKATVMPLDTAFQVVTGLTPDELSEAWQTTVRTYYQPFLEQLNAPDSAGARVLARDLDAGDMNIAPALSPDGRYVAFLSERDLFSIDLYLADARTGEIVDQLTSSGIDPHFEALRFIDSAGSWSPDGTRFAYVVFAEGDNEIIVHDIRTNKVVERFSVEGVGAIKNTAWSPDGRSIAFAGIRGGLSDLYVLDLDTEDVRQLTDDRYADLHPTWSPDGRTLAFATDRGPGGTDFERLAYAPLRLGLLDVATGELDVRVPFPGAKHINPQFAPDGRSLYFISDRDGVSNVYRLDTRANDVYQVTNVATGVSGITSLAPALSVASQSGRMMFSVFNDNNYTVFSLAQPETQGTAVEAKPRRVAAAGLLPPVEGLRTEGLVSTYLTTPGLGLPEAETFESEAYKSKLRLSYVGPPSLGVGYDSQFGAGVSGGLSFLFSDLLGNQMLGTTVQVNGNIRDVGGQVFYLNRGNRWNYGAQLSHTPYLTGSARISRVPDSELYVQEQFIRRTFFSGGQLFAHYPFSSTRRFEVEAGYNHLWYDLDVERILIDPFSGQRLDREREDLPSPDALDFAQASAAFVGDYANIAFTSPIRGGRYRIEAGYTTGSFNYGTVLADYRRYFFARPVTFAFGAYHYGRYFTGDASERRLYPLNLGYSMYNVRGVHGYGINSFDVTECEGTEECAVIDRVVGSRVAVASLEVRYPFLGTSDFGLINFPYLPTELALFGDAGVAWTADRAPDFRFTQDNTSDNVPVFSVGAAARMNLLGYAVLEVFYAIPFQRPDKTGHLGFALQPGW